MKRNQSPWNPLSAADFAAFTPEKTLKDIAAELGRGYDTTRIFACKHGLPFKNLRPRDEDVEPLRLRALQMRRRKVSAKVASEMLDVSYTRVCKWYREAGLASKEIEL